MSRQPLPHLWMFVGRVIVDDDVDHFSRRDLRLDRTEEADELLMPMALHVAADDGAIEDVEGGEQRGGTLTLVDVRHRPGAARFHRQPRLGTVERLDLAHMGIYGSRCSDQIFIVARLVARQPFDAMNRACHRHTTGFDLLDRRMISAVPQSSAVARMMAARHTCFCGALRSEMIASS
jgi:hypothetical protein